MFLAAERKLAFQRRAGNRAPPGEFRLGVAAPDTVRRGEEHFGGDGFGNRQDRRERFVFHLDRVGGEPARLAPLADDERDELAVK